MAPPGGDKSDKYRHWRSATTSLAACLDMDERKPVSTRVATDITRATVDFIVEDMVH